MKAKPVEFFFTNWNYAEEEKKRLFSWIETVVENQEITESHISGFTVDNASMFVRWNIADFKL